MKNEEKLEIFKNEESIEKILEIINKELEEEQIYNVYFEECYGNDETILFNEFSKSLKGVKEENDSDSHRWYIIHQDIYKYTNPKTKESVYLGVWHVGEHKSESQSDSDVCVIPQFYEVEQFTTVGYR
jgi:hypothetical protein